MSDTEARLKALEDLCARLVERVERLEPFNKAESVKFQLTDQESLRKALEIMWNPDPTRIRYDLYLLEPPILLVQLRYKGAFEAALTKAGIEFQEIVD